MILEEIMEKKVLITIANFASVVPERRIKGKIEEFDGEFFKVMVKDKIVLVRSQFISTIEIL